MRKIRYSNSYVFLANTITIVVHKANWGHDISWHVWLNAFTLDYANMLMAMFIVFA